MALEATVVAAFAATFTPAETTTPTAFSALQQKHTLEETL